MPVRTRLSALVLVAASAAVAGLVGCNDARPAAKAKPEASPQPEIPSTLTVMRADLVSPHQVQGPLAEPTRGQVLDVLQRVFAATMTGPLIRGTAGDIRDLFTPDAGAQALGQDRATVFDDGMPTARTLQVDRAEVRLTGLANEVNQPGMVVAQLRWEVVGADGVVRIVRGGELSLVPRDGRWVVAGYTLTVARSVAEVTTTTSATSR